MNHFNSERALQGWTLTGGWRLYHEAPQSRLEPATPFASSVFGTDGNRAAPYPGEETETSTATTPARALPATLNFLSWNQDEAEGYDRKSIHVSVDGGTTFVQLHACIDDASQPYCEGHATRDADDWDVVSIDVPAELVGQVGVVQFRYDTVDSCCNYEKGWYLDDLDFATPCACTSNEACDAETNPCGISICGVEGECQFAPASEGVACGDAAESDCNLPDTCDGLGLCRANQEPSGLTYCTDCPFDEPSCNPHCQDGYCENCSSFAELQGFDGDASLTGWTIETFEGTAGWGLYNAAPASSAAPANEPIVLEGEPVLGTDGNRVAPYPGGEEEHSRITSLPDTVPASITFRSWNVDEGGAEYDNKLVELSVDDGLTWVVLADCSVVDAPFPFCENVETRAGDDWDDVALDTSAYVGQVGRLRFTYDTIDGCCEGERGWFIDDLNFAQSCSDPQFP